MSAHFVKAKDKSIVSAKSAMAQVRRNVQLAQLTVDILREAESAITLKVPISGVGRVKERHVLKLM
jgi:hypothetical protein